MVIKLFRMYAYTGGRLRVKNGHFPEITTYSFVWTWLIFRRSSEIFFAGKFPPWVKTEKAGLKTFFSPGCLSWLTVVLVVLPSSRTIFGRKSVIVRWKRLLEISYLKHSHLRPLLRVFRVLWSGRVRHDGRVTGVRVMIIFRTARIRRILNTLQTTKAIN